MSALVEMRPIFRLYELLLEAGRERRTMMYGELASLLGLTLNQHGRATLGQWLALAGDMGLSEYGIALPVLAVTKRDGLPSGRRVAGEKPLSGFWWWADLHDYDITDPYKLVVEEQRRVFARLAPPV